VLYNRANNGGLGLSGTMSGHTLSITPGFQSSHTFLGEHSSLVSPRSEATLASTSTMLAHAPLNSTTETPHHPPASSSSTSHPPKSATLPYQNQPNSIFYPSSNQSPITSYLNRNNYINSSSRVISSSTAQKAGNLF
jgi:hypothetical protein